MRLRTGSIAPLIARITLAPVTDRENSVQRHKAVLRFAKNGYQNLVRRLFRKNNPETPSTAAEKITFLVKKNVKPHLDRGRDHLRQNRFSEAIQEFLIAVDIDPACALSYFNLGYAYHELGQLDTAREYYEKAIELEPTCALFLENLARLNFEVLDFSEAARVFQRASSSGAIQPLSLGLWGRALFEQGLYEESIDAFKKLHNQNPQPVIQAGAQYWQAVAHIKMGRLAAARNITEALLHQEDTDSKILYDLGEHFIEARCLGIARNLFEKLAGRPEDFPLARLRLEDIHALEKQIDEMLPKLFDGDEEHLLYQIHTLQEFGDERISKALLSLIQSSSAPVRESIIRYQTRFGFPVSGKIISLLADKVDYVRDAAYEHLLKSDSPDFVDAMCAGLLDPFLDIRKKAVIYLGLYGTMEHLPNLDMALSHPANSGITQEIRQAMALIKRRYQKNIDTLFYTSPAPLPQTEIQNPSNALRFWIMIFLQAALIGYFLYVLLVRW